MEGLLMRLEHDRNRGKEMEVRECLQCGRTLGKYYDKDVCPLCMEINLFAEVKEFIRSNDVRELDVANHFNIPVSKVRSWVKQGRIEYKTLDGRTVSGVYCQVCGKKLEFGTVCPECRKLEQLQVVSAEYGETQKGEMRFLGNVEKSQEKNK